MSKDLPRKISIGIFWSALSLLLRRGASFFISLVLARLLFPEDYGLIGMALVFTKLAGVICEAGIGDAIIQMEDSRIRIGHYHSTFWASSIWAVILFLGVISFGGQLVADFYEEPQLVKLASVLSIPFLFSPYNAVARAKLTRDFRFQELAKIHILVTIVAGLVGIIAAFLQAGVWSLALYSILPPLLSLPLYKHYGGYVPKVYFEAQSFKEVLGFGSKTMGANITNTFIGQIDYLLVSKLLSKYALGIYTFAFTITDMIRSQIMQVVNKVMLPGYSKIQNDNLKLREAYKKVVVYNALVVYPVMGVLFLFCKPLIQIFFGSKWIDSVPIVEILCGATFFHMLVNSNTTLIRGKGYAGLEFGLQLFKGVCIFLPSVYLGLTYFGVIGAAYAVMLNRIIAIPIAYVVLFRLIGLRPPEVLSSLKGVLIAFGTSMLVGYSFIYFISSYLVLIGIPVMLIFYSVLCFQFYGKEIEGVARRAGINLDSLMTGFRLK